MTARGRRAGDALRRFPMKVGGGFGPRPPILTGLEFWGDLNSANTSIISTAVATLGDSSGNARDFTQGTAANRPSYTSSDANFGGRPTMTFDGTNDALTRGTAYGNFAGRTFYAVFRIPSSTADARIYSDQTGAVASNCYLHTSNTLGIVAAYNNPAGTVTAKAQAISVNTTYVVGAAFDFATGAAAVPRLYLNGVATGSYASTAASNGTTFASGTHGLGSGSNGVSSLFTGTIATVLDYSVTHTDAQMRQISAWLKWRFGL